MPFQEWENEEDDCLVISDDEEMDDADDIGTIFGRSMAVHKAKCDRFDKVVSGRVVGVEEMGKRVFACSVGYGKELE